MADIEFRGVTKVFRAPGGSGRIRAVDNLNLTIREGESVALVGESGSGKSTIARMLVRLETPTEGIITFNGQSIHRMSDLSRRIQMVLQDPFSSFNPMHTISYSLRRPLEIRRDVDKEDIPRRVAETLRQVGLVPPESFLEKRANQLSGGQRQRANIARALLLEPEVLVADEPTSMLDVSVGIGVLNVLLDLREKRQGVEGKNGTKEVDIKNTRMSYLFITHNLAAARYIADRMVVLYRGQVVEEGLVDDVIHHPLHPYTRMLIAATPDAEKPLQLDPTLDVESGASHQGCKFASRCPFRQEECSSEIQYKKVENQMVRCVLY